MARKLPSTVGRKPIITPISVEPISLRIFSSAGGVAGGAPAAGGTKGGNDSKMAFANGAVGSVAALRWVSTKARTAIFKALPWRCPTAAASSPGLGWNM